MSYLAKNKEYWDKGYNAPNVEGWVFRPYGRILKPEFGLKGPGQTMLDWGCGQGGALNFFRDQGFNAYGVDISVPDIEAARNAGHNVSRIDPKPSMKPYFPGVSFDLVVSVQSFYYLNNTDMETCLASVYEQMKPGAILYATMMGTKCWYYRHSTPAEDGLRAVNFTTPRLTLKDYFINFTESREELIQRFHKFTPIHIGYYDAVWLESEGPEFHWTYIGKKG